MENLKLIPISVSELFYLKVRDKIIDKINIEGFDAIVEKIVNHEIYAWKNLTNPLLKRQYKLLTIVHSKSQIKTLVTNTLNYYLKGYKTEKKKIAIKGSQGWEEFLIGAALGAAFGFVVDRVWEYFDEDTTYHVVEGEDGVIYIYELDEDGNIINIREGGYVISN